MCRTVPSQKSIDFRLPQTSFPAYIWTIILSGPESVLFNRKTLELDWSAALGLSNPHIFQLVRSALWKRQTNKMKDGWRLVFVLVVATIALVESKSGIRRRRRTTHVLEVESSSAFVESLWESDGIRNVDNKDTFETKAEPVSHDGVKTMQASQKEEKEIERVLMGERMTAEMSMSFYMMF